VRSPGDGGVGDPAAAGDVGSVGVGGGVVHVVVRIGWRIGWRCGRR
jgi:hypothetical protein